MRARISEATYNQIKKSGGFTIQEGGKVTVKVSSRMGKCCFRVFV